MEVPLPLSDIPLLLFIAIGALVVVYFAISFICETVYLFDLDGCARGPVVDLRPEKTIPGNLLLLGPPLSGKSRALRGHADIFSVDLAAIDSKERWSPELIADTIPKGKVAGLDHFDFRIDDMSVNQKKLQLLERLIYKHNRKVVIVSCVDPLFYVTDEASAHHSSHDAYPEQVPGRWARVLRLFTKVEFRTDTVSDFEQSESVFNQKISTRQPDQSEPLDRRFAGAMEVTLPATSEKACSLTAKLRATGKETGEISPTSRALSHEQIIRELTDKAHAYYRAVWATCTTGEKLTLVQLAQEGLVNPNNESTIRELLRKGLIYRCATFRIMNESFKRFVITSFGPDDVRMWEAEASSAAWNLLNTTIRIGGVGLVGFLVVTQPRFLQTATGFLTALGAGLPTVINLLATLKRAPRPGPSEH